MTQGEFIHFRWVMEATLFNLDGMDAGVVGTDGRLGLIAGFLGELELD
ncbi:MAG: hypothetical protein ACI9VR_003915 [Cognaticolwellia sp.]